MAGAAAAITPTTLGLGSVDNTADSAKPVSTLQAAALAAKIDTTVANSTYGTAADQFALRRLGDLAAGDRSNSVTRLRRDRDDATGFNETWANLTAWNPATQSQVSAGKVYGLGTIQNPGGGGRAFVVPKNSRFRITGTINFVAGGTDWAMFGLWANTGALPANGTYSLMWGLLGNQPKRWNASTFVPGYPTSNMYAVGASALITVSTTYTVTIESDELGISASLIDAAHTVEWTDRIPWSAIPEAANYVSASYWLNDTRQLSGTSIGPIAATTSINTIVPRTNVEGAADWVVTAVDSAANTMRVCVPKAYDSRTPSPVVIYHHGVGEDSNGPFSEVVKRAFIQSLVDAGYIVASTLAGSNNWGNDAGINAYVNLYQYLRDHFAIGPVHHLGQSMGGLSATLTLAARKVPAASLALIYPATNLAASYANASFTAGINTAYGISGDYAAKTAGHDPALMAGTAFRGVPVWGIASTDDVTMNKAANLDAFVTAVTPYAAEVTTLTSTGTHGDASNFSATPQASLLAFLARNSLGSGA
ncbi:alpha/beta hydrolase [Candidatus Saccharibacteria bacterium]|nr:alpha/beta hydrolase [Candidatus Saccharibacteria bacterium]MBI3337688.1 alpha/beta hydrolase [Candidatus Saccharibacteria bacterium]